jgi:hypothetical protein
MSPPRTGSPQAWSMRSNSITAPNATRGASFTSSSLLGDKHGNNADHGLFLGLDNMNHNGSNTSSLRMGMAADSNRYSPELTDADSNAYMRASGGDGRSSMRKRSGTALNGQVDYAYGAPAKRLRSSGPHLARSIFLNESVR